MIWIIIIACVIFVVYKKGAADASLRKAKPTAAANNIASAEWMARQQIGRITDAIRKGDYATAARESDDTLKYVDSCATSAEKYAYLRIISGDSLMYYGNMYPNRRDSLLEDLVREKISMSST